MVFKMVLARCSEDGCLKEAMLSDEEERQAEEQFRQENVRLLEESIDEARQLAIRKKINDDEIVARLAVALFEKKAITLSNWKEKKAQEKYGHYNKNGPDHKDKN